MNIAQWMKNSLEDWTVRKMDQASLLTSFIFSIPKAAESVHLYWEHSHFSSSFSAELWPCVLSLVPLVLSEVFFFWIDAAVQLVSAWTPEKMRGLPQCSQWKDIPGGKFFEQNQIYFAMANSQRKGRMEQEQWWKKMKSVCRIAFCMIA